MKKTLHLLSLILISTFSFSQYKFDTVYSKIVGPGVRHSRINIASGPWTLNVMEIDIKNPYLKFETVKAKDNLYGGLEQPSAISKRKSYQDHYVIGVINGDFYNTGTPLGYPTQMQIANGEILKRQSSTFTSIGFDNKNNVIMGTPIFSGSIITKNSSIPINGINESRNTNNLTIFNSYNGASTGTNSYGNEALVHPINEWFANDTVVCIVDNLVINSGNTSIPKNSMVISGHGTSADFISANINKGDTIKVVTKIFPAMPKIKELIGGYPYMLKNGNYNFNPDDALMTARHPRTMAGFNKDSTKLYLAVVDGRQVISIGMNGYEMVDLMKQFGAYNAINMDGGGSSAMVIRDQVVNYPSDPGGERYVGNALMVVSIAPPTDLSFLNILEDIADVFQGSTFQFHAEGKDQYFNPLPLPSGVLWECDSKIGTITQDGLFTSKMINDSGYVRIKYNAIVDSVKVRVRVINKIRVYPQTLNMVPGERLTLTVKGMDSGNNKLTLQNTQVTFINNSTNLDINSDGVVTSTGFGKGTVTVKLDTVTKIIEYNSSGNDTSVLIEDFNDLFLWSFDVQNTDPDNIWLNINDSSIINNVPAFKIDYSFPDQFANVFMKTDLPVSSRVDSIYLKIFGDGGGHTLKLFFRDKDGELFSINSQTVVNWKNEWRNVGFRMVYATPVSVGTVDYPITLTQLQITLGSQNKVGSKAAGKIFLDEIKVHYPDRNVSPTILFDFNSGITGWLQPSQVNVAQVIGVVTASSKLEYSTEHPYEGSGCGKWTFIDDSNNSTNGNSDWSIRIARGTTSEIGLMLRGSYIGAWVWADGETNLTLRTVIRDGAGQICQGPPFKVNHKGWKLIGTKLDENLFTPYLTSGKITDANNKFNGFRVEGPNSVLNGKTRVLYIDKMVTSALTVPTGFSEVGSRFFLGLPPSPSEIQIYWIVNSEISVNRYVVELETSNGFVEIAAVKAEGNIDTAKTYYYSGNANLSSRYRIKQITNDGAIEYSQIISAIQVSVNTKEELGDNFVLMQNYPNPFNPTTNIDFYIPKTCNVSLKIFDILGREVKTIVNEKMNSGKHTVIFDTRLVNGGLPSGVYFYQLSSEYFVQSKKLVLLK